MALAAENATITAATIRLLSGLNKIALLRIFVSDTWLNLKMLL